MFQFKSIYMLYFKPLMGTKLITLGPRQDQPICGVWGAGELNWEASKQMKRIRIQNNLQVNKWSKKHKDNKSLLGSILIKQKNYCSQLKNQKEVTLKCNLESPHNYLALRFRGLLLQMWLLSRLPLLITPCSMLSRTTFTVYSNCELTIDIWKWKTLEKDKLCSREELHFLAG